jgi:hypothetical protein
VIDYQNVHLTGHGLFTNDRPRHETLIDPLLFASRLLQARNRAQRPGHPAAVLRRVLVYRGQPSNVHDPRAYARSQAQNECRQVLWPHRRRECWPRGWGLAVS